MWKKLRKNIILKYAVAVLAVVLIGYLAVAPVLIQNVFPHYAIAKKYTKIEVCTDLAPGTPSTFFLPVSCVSLSAIYKIGCVYQSPGYVAPARASTDEKILCKVLVRGTDDTGAKNQALAVLPISENALRNIIALSFVSVLVIAYIIFTVVRRKNIQKSY